MDTSSAISVTSDESDATCATLTATANKSFEAYADSAAGEPDNNSDIDISENRSTHEADSDE